MNNLNEETLPENIMLPATPNLDSVFPLELIDAQFQNIPPELVTEEAVRFGWNLGWRYGWTNGYNNCWNRGYNDRMNISDMRMITPPGSPNRRNTRRGGKRKKNRTKKRKLTRK